MKTKIEFEIAGTDQRYCFDDVKMGDDLAILHGKEERFVYHPRHVAIYKSKRNVLCGEKLALSWLKIEHVFDNREGGDQ